VRRSEPMSAGEIAGWGALGLVTGLVLGTALGAWAGGVSRERLSRAARRLRAPASPARHSVAATAAAALEALAAEPSLAHLTLEVTPIGLRSVELRGWVADRAERTLAARTVRQVAGIETVINSILVRGEDDRPRSPSVLPANQTA
jgi:hypothetical protein